MVFHWQGICSPFQQTNHHLFILEEKIMKSLFIGLLVVFTALAEAQMQVVSTNPANNTLNVPLSTTFQITFNSPIDTNQVSGEKSFLMNLDTIVGQSYSGDLKTITFSLHLKPATMYFVMAYGIPAQGGGRLSIPSTTFFSTASSFPTGSVSGTVFSGATGVSPANALVILSSRPVGDGNPVAVAGAVANGAGNYSIPYAPAGKYYPLSAQDANGDGGIDPTSGDVLAMGDTIHVQNSAVSNVNLTFQSFGAFQYSAAKHVADSASLSALPSDKVLRMVQAWEADSTGKSGNWTFYYTSASASAKYELQIDPFGVRLRTPDSMMAQSFTSMKPIVGTPALPDSFVARAERAGGKAFRTHTVPDSLQFHLSVKLGSLYWSEFYWMVPDQELYWGADYAFGRQVTQNEWRSYGDMKFVGDFSTGNILSITGVEEKPDQGVPQRFELSQNYPNPFNPSTTLKFALPIRSQVTLAIYNLLGQKIAVLEEGEMPAGFHSVEWSPNVASGVYFYRLEAASSSDAGNHFVQVKRMLLVK